MIEVFSFIKPPILHLLEISGEIVPGIEKAVALYNDEIRNTLAIKMIKKPTENSTVEDLFFLDAGSIHDLRMKYNSFAWLNLESLPFETVELNKTQLNIFDELEHIVLCLPFKNSIDKKSDLLILYLNRNKANFGMANSEVPLTTNEKSLIGNLLYNSFKSRYKQVQKDSKILIKTNNRYKNLLEENKNLKTEIDHLRNNYNYSQVIESKKIVNEISINYQTNLKLGNDAIAKIQNYKGSFDNLKRSISNSAISAINLNFGNSSNDIVLSEFDIVLINEEVDKGLSENKLPERYEKTVQLLDKLENAAKLVVETQKKLTSENVGNACPIPISAPAISDALKNHHKKVYNLMEQFPERWPIIKNEFRPVKNILLSKTG